MPLSQHSLFMKAARRESVTRTPIWLMRQAGRYLPNYRRLRRDTSFLELCRNPALCAEVMVETVEMLGVDAAIIFSDLLLILEPMGLGLEFTAGEGPVLHNAIHRAENADHLTELTDLDALGYVFETVRKTREMLDERLPVIGFAGAPFTLAAYAIEGGSSRDYRLAKTLMFEDSGAWRAIMERLTRALTRYLNAQIDAGAQAVQIFDSWVGCLGPEEYRRNVLPYNRALIESLRPGTPVIHFATGNPALTPMLAEAGGARRAELVVGVDWRIRLDDARSAIGYDMAIQGNLDPVVLLTNPEEIRRRAWEILDQNAGRPGHIFNLGHGVLPQTPPENVFALIAAVHAYSEREG